MKSELSKRIISSVFLLSLVFLSAIISDYLFLSLLFVSIILSWIEWVKIIEKISLKRTSHIMHIILFLIYLFAAFIICFNIFVIDKYFFITILMICVFSDIGGYLFGKTFGGKNSQKLVQIKQYLVLLDRSFYHSLVFLIYYYLAIFYS